MRIVALNAGKQTKKAPLLRCSPYAVQYEPHRDMLPNMEEGPHLVGHDRGPVKRLIPQSLTPFKAHLHVIEPVSCGLLTMQQLRIPRRMRAARGCTDTCHRSYHSAEARPQPCGPA